jgi:hypothetical protein
MIARDTETSSGIIFVTVRLRVFVMNRRSMLPDQRPEIVRALEPGHRHPSLDERLALGCVPVLLQIPMARVTLSAPAVMTEPALERHQPCPVKLTAIVVQEIASSRRELLQTEIPFRTVEGGRKHAEAELRSHLEHHPVGQPGVEHPCCLGQGPPPWPPAIRPTVCTGAGFRRRIPLR